MNSQYFGFNVLRIYLLIGCCEYSRFFDVLYVLRMIADSRYFGVRYYYGGYLLCLEVFRGSVLRVLQVVALFGPLTLRVLRVLAVPKILSVCPVAWEYMRIILGPSVHRACR